MVILRVLASLVVLIAFAWASLAIFYQLPKDVAALLIAGWVSMGVTGLILLWRGYAGIGALVLAAMLLLFAMWWHFIKPSDARDWSPDVAEHVVSRIEGDLVTLQNVRNFAWRTEEDFNARWETRTYDLAKLASVDVSCSYWMGPAIAHTLVSFGFSDGQFVTFSIEIRKEQGESFSAIGGFFKKFETTLIAADERDILRVRTNVRGEDVYLYRVAGISKDDMRALFMGYLDQGKALLDEPRWYNTATGNCTTIVWEIAHHVVKDKLPLDYRLLVSGYLPDYLYDSGALTPGVDFQTLRDKGRITDRAKAADEAPDFSTRIREGVPGT